MSERLALSPFLKWAGGKRWLVRDHPSLFDFRMKERYVEPFLGSGAVYFKLRPERALLNDLNSELIETYRTIRSDWKKVETLLLKHHAKHDSTYFYDIRASSPRSQAARAARFIYLNRTCFNGLYRVNRQGHFNVPIGTKTAVMLGTDNFEQIAEALNGVEFRCQDFESVIDDCGIGDFIFADPPYTVKHNNNGFVKYNEKLFSWADQERLQGSLVSAAKRGARIILTNADHPSVRELYRDCDVRVVERQSIMASQSFRRKKTSEMLVFL